MPISKMPSVFLLPLAPDERNRADLSGPPLYMGQGVRGLAAVQP